MSKKDLAQIIAILQNQYLRGGVEAAEAEQIIMLLLGKEQGKEMLKLFNLIISN